MVVQMSHNTAFVSFSPAPIGTTAPPPTKRQI